MTERRQWRKELEFLVLCVQLPFDDSKLDPAIDLLDGAIDWEFLVETSYAHAVTPLLCHALGLLPEPLIPGDVLEAAQSHLEENRSRNADMTTELMRILGDLKNAGIPSIPFKGPYIAEKYYGDPALRRYNDLDFLVDQDFANETGIVIRALGYEATLYAAAAATENTKYPRRDDATWRFAGEYLYVHTEKPFAVEPHWAFAPPTLGLDLDYAKIWTRARPSTLSAAPILALGPEDTVLSLALHGAKSNWTRLQWILDIDRAVKCEAQIDWKALLAEAEQAGLLRILLVAMQLVQTIFGSKMASCVLTALENDKIARTLAAERIAALFSKNNDDFSNAAITRDWSRLLNRPGDKARYVFRTLVTPRMRHFETLPLPDRLFFVYYAFKPAYDYLVIPLWDTAKNLGLVRRSR
jgi:hypothetical protein